MRGRILLGAALGLMLLAGCQRGLPLAEKTPDPPPDQSIPGSEQVPAVYTDWSKLEEYEPQGPIPARYHEAHMDRLIPRDDYGPLVPFPGAHQQERQFDGNYHYRYGLMTLDGRVVVDAVYDSIVPLASYDMDRRSSRPLPLFLMKRFVEDPAETEGYREEHLLAAADGSWVTEDYSLPWYGLDGPVLLAGEDGMLVATRTGDALVLLGMDGREIYRWGQGELPALRGEEKIQKLTCGWQDGLGLVWDREEEKGYILDGPRVVEMDVPLEPDQQIDLAHFHDGLIRVVEHGRWGYLDHNGDFAIPPQYGEATDFVDGVALVQDAQGFDCHFIDTRGQVLGHAGEGFQLELVTLQGEVWSTLRRTGTETAEGERCYLRWQDGGIEEYATADGWRCSDVLWRALEGGGAEYVSAGGIISTILPQEEVLGVSRTKDRLVVGTPQGEYLCESSGRRLAGPYGTIMLLPASAAIILSEDEREGMLVLDWDGAVQFTAPKNDSIYWFTASHGMAEYYTPTSYGVRSLHGGWVIRFLRDPGDF